MASASESTIRPFLVSTEPLTVGSRWKKWKRALQYHIEARGVTNAERRRAILLDCAGEEVQDIYDTLQEGTDGDAYVKAMTALDQYFTPKTNIPYERSVFRRAGFHSNETVASYVTRLKQLAVTCEFEERDTMIRDQVIEKCPSLTLRKKLLEQGSTLDLDTVLALATTEESVVKQADEIQAQGNGVASKNINGNGTVNRVSEKTGKRHRRTQSQQHSANSNSSASKDGKKVCFRCKSPKHLASSQDCPARDRVCRVCSKKGHYAGSKFCEQGKSRNVNNVSEGACPTLQNEDYNIETLFAITDTDINKASEVLPPNSSSGKVDVKLNDVTVQALIDSGASCNLMDRHTAKSVNANIVQTSKKLYPYGSSSKHLDLFGQANIDVFVPANGNFTTAVFYIFNGNAATLISKSSAECLGLLRVGPLSGRVNSCSSGGSTGLGVRPWVDKYPQCFAGVGCLKDYKVSLHIDTTVQPVAQPVRRMPFGHRDLARAKIDELLAADIIERVEGPTPWVSPIVTVPKDNNDIRLCVDMRQANKAIVRERHPIPTIQELLFNLNGAKVFSKVDLKLGFHQFELDEQSKSITTFVTPFGLFQYKRLMFGIASAPEIYQYQIQKAISGLTGCQNYADDIIIFGSSKEEHDERLNKFLQRMTQLGLTLNASKCQFGLDEVSYVGYNISSKGVKICPKKLKSIADARVPRDVSELRSFMGLVNFVGKFVPKLSTHAEPLLRLTKKNTPFAWGTEQNAACCNIKALMADSKTLAFFDANAQTSITADASPYGLGAVLSQTINGTERVIAYGHRSLTKTERRYSQTEREALALVWACEHFALYLLGIKFRLVTDHKPLQFIFNRTTSQPTPRIERWVLRLQAFNYEVVYKPGSQNIADPLSRLSVSEDSVYTVANVADSYIKLIANESVPVALTFSQIKAKATECLEMKLVKQALWDGRWDKCLPIYKAVSAELSQCDGVILRGNRLVIPTSLRMAVVRLAHEGHLGLTKTKQRLRSKVWWPSMDKDVEKACNQCFECQLVSAPNKPAPVSCTKLPDQPWQHTACDLLGPLPNGESIFVMVDYYSRYFEICFLRSTTAAKVIEACEDIFSRWGLPISVRTDNGPQFGCEFQAYLKQNGVFWFSTTPMWPAANGEVERQNRSLLKSLKVAQNSGRNYRSELRKFLMAYRSTPHSVTGVSPAELMMGRQMRTKLPCLERCEPRLDEEVRDRQVLAKLKTKEYVDAKRGARETEIAVGDTVLVRAEKTNKLSPNFSPEKHQIVSRQGSEVIVSNENSGRQFRRNLTEVRKLPNPQIETDNAEDEVEVETCTDSNAGRPKRDRNPPVRFGCPIAH